MAGRLLLGAWSRVPQVRTSLRGYAKSAEERLGLEKPKRPPTAYIRFVGDLRSELIAKNPGLAPTEVVKLASQRWNGLDKETKEKLGKRYESEVAAYKKRKEAFEASLTDAQKSDIKRLEHEMSLAKEKKKYKAEIKELGKPKRPESSYLLFCRSEKDSFTSTSSVVEAQAKLKEKWYALPKDEKDKWEKKAAALMDAYRKELTKWEEKMIKMGNVEFVRNAVSKPVTKPKHPRA